MCTAAHYLSQSLLLHPSPELAAGRKLKGDSSLSGARLARIQHHGKHTAENMVKLSLCDSLAHAR
jgi:hypothetical protein